MFDRNASNNDLFALCASVNQGGASDYIAATALLLILPLALVGGLTLWIRRAERDAEASRS